MVKSPQLKTKLNSLNNLNQKKKKRIPNFLLEKEYKSKKNKNKKTSNCPVKPLLLIVSNYVVDSVLNYYFFFS